MLLMYSFVTIVQIIILTIVISSIQPVFGFVVVVDSPNHNKGYQTNSQQKIHILSKNSVSSFEFDTRTKSIGTSSSTTRNSSIRQQRPSLFLLSKFNQNGVETNNSNDSDVQTQQEQDLLLKNILTVSTKKLSRTAFITTLLSIPTSAAIAAVQSNDSGRNLEPGTIQQQQQQIQNSMNSNNNVMMKEESISGFISGGVLAFVKTLVKYPLDTVTVRLQMPKELQSNTINNNNSIVNTIQQLFNGCYNGIVPPLLLNVPAAAIFFAVKDSIKVVLKNYNSNTQSNKNIYFSKTGITLIAVGIANIPYWLIRTPVEVVKTRQQAKLFGYYGTNVTDIDCYKKVISDVIINEQNYNQNTNAITESQQQQKTNKQIPFLSIGKEFYTGYNENIVYAYPADVIKFLLYEQLTIILQIQQIQQQQQQQGQQQQQRSNAKSTTSISPINGAIAGAISTAIAQLVTTPLDVVRNRIMTKTIVSLPTTTTTTVTNNTVVQQQEDTTTISYIDMLLTIGKEEGISGLFAGAVPRVSKALISGAIQFATYEETKQTIANFFIANKLKQ